MALPFKAVQNRIALTANYQSHFMMTTGLSCSKSTMMCFETKTNSRGDGRKKDYKEKQKIVKGGDDGKERSQ